jgi:hypothetical protein
MPSLADWSGSTSRRRAPGSSAARLVYLPRMTRLATATLTALAGADLLQYACVPEKTAS